MFEVFDDDALQQGGRHPRVPDAFRVHHNDWPAFADTEARRLAPFHPVGAKQEPFALKESREQRIQLSPTTVGGAIAARAHEDVSRVRDHGWRV